MSVPVLIGVGMLGGVGALARFFVDGAIGERLATSFPFGTFVVNLSGSFALGVLVGATADPDAIRLAATGLLGSYTTFSTWVLESQRLSEEGQPRAALANILISLACGISLTWAGLKLGAAL